MEPTTKKDCYSEITNAIIADLEIGVRPWIKPWQSDGHAVPAGLFARLRASHTGASTFLLFCGPLHIGKDSEAPTG